VMEVTSVKRIHQSDWTDFGVRFLRARDIVAESKNESVSEPLFISQKKYDEYTAISGKVTKGDLLVTGVGTIGIPMLIEKNEPIYFKDGNIIWFKNENHIDGQFFYYSFIGKKIQSFIKESAGIGTVGTFTINTGKNTPIDLPVLKKEQEAIGNFFSDLDQLITLHQRKLDDVKELKKALLQKMFPKGNGNDFPELRFPEFTDAWKQRKLGEVSKRVTRRNKELISSLPLTISAQHGLVDQEEFFNKQVASKDVSSYYLIKKGEFAYNKSYSNGYPWGAIKRLDRYEMGVLSTLYIVFKPTSLICSDYLVSYYDTVNWYKEVSMIAAEGARNHGLLNIAPNDFFKTRLFIPTLPEQEAIGSFFSDLDQLITLHQRQLDHLKLLKKALLQQMFI
ncbi:TPA: restriction endonuclease subunit S, partial [Streptococcus suis]|nr:restriction endonuclease subunit S [Streptococcus suis]